MNWFKVDDAFVTHPKTIAAGNAAIGLWTRAGAWSMQHLTDGRVPQEIVRRLGTITQAERLVAAGLWKPTPDGYRFHEWDTYQASGQEIRARRAEWRGRQKKHRHGRDG